MFLRVYKGVCARDIFPNNARRHVFSIFVPVTHGYVNRRLDFSAFAQADNDDALARAHCLNGPNIHGTNRTVVKSRDLKGRQDKWGDFSVLSSRENGAEDSRTCLG